MRALACPDKFRGTATAAEAAAAIAAGARQAGSECVELPLADGGEGTLAALGGANRVTSVTGPLGSPVDAGWRLDGELAVVEMALAAGLGLTGGAAGNSPLAATSRGVGELIAAAVAAGARRVVVGVGGSATTDGGEGALAALAALVPFPDHGIEIEVACDVTTEFVDAAAVFGPQKGATPAQVVELEARLRRLARRYRRELGVDVTAVAGAGAAGGLAGGLAAAGARLSPGFALVAGIASIDAAVAGADIVVTGEGLLDRTSLAGKVVGGVAVRAASLGRPVLVVAGDVAPAVVVPGAEVISLVEQYGSERALTETTACISDAVASHLAAFGLKARSAPGGGRRNGPPDGGARLP